MFTIFISGLGGRTECTMSKSADDTKLGEGVNTPDDCAAIQRLVDSLETWANWKSHEVHREVECPAPREQ